MQDRMRSAVRGRGSSQVWLGLALWCVGWAAALPAGADGIPCGRFLELPEEARAAYVWGLVDGAMAVRASYQLDVRLLRRDGDQVHAEQSDFVAQAIVEKIRPVLHRPATDLLREMEARCKDYAIPVRTVLAYLQTLDEWRREP